MDDDEIKKKRVYGRRAGRPLNSMRRQAMEERFPKISIGLELLGEKGDAVPCSFFSSRYKEYWLEIGFGTGEHLIELVKKYPDTGFLGVEPYLNGMAAFVKDAPENQDNYRVLMDDAMLLAHSLIAKSVSRIYVLNPDPWPKTRHHKRRIINQENLTAFARILKTGGQLIMATDVDDLAEWMVTECSNHPDFNWTAERDADWKTPPDEWIETRFAAKGRRAGRKQSFLIFERK